MTQNTPPSQPADWLDQILGTLAEDLIAYDKRMTEAGAPPLRCVHKYLKKAKVAIREHERQAVQAARKESGSAIASVFLTLLEQNGLLSELGEGVLAELQATQPPAADTTKQGESDE